MGASPAAGARYRLAERIEQYLGDPADARTLFSYANCAALDAREEFPAEICRELDAWGVAEYYVPAEFGGRLDDYEQLLQLMRAVARRDLTVAIGHGKTYLGAACVWVAGSREQAERLAGRIKAGTPVALGLTERDHGSDLLAGQVAAVAGAAGGFRVDGEKWLINNATRGGMLTLLARTDPAGGPRGFSTLLVDKRELPPGGYTCLDKVRTLGIRGADISGIAFHGAEVPQRALIGSAGAGVETVLKALQFTRIMCVALSLGAADHALRLTLDFTRARTLYGRTLIELPKTRHTLAAAAADLLAAEALAIVASRAVHALTGELSVVSAVAKYLVPTETDALIARLAGQIGARAFLEGVYAHGMFQKVDRDHRIVGLFDGNTAVNLSALINQFRALARGYGRAQADPGTVRALFRLDAPLPPVDPARLALVARGGSAVTGSLPALLDALREDIAGREAAPEPDGAGAGALRGALASAERLAAAADRVHREMVRERYLVPAAPPRAFELARQYSLCFAGAACLGLWTHNRRAGFLGSAAPLWRDGLWLRAALDRLLDRLGEPPADDTATAYDQVLSHLCGARDRGELFSLLPLALAGGGADQRRETGGRTC
jgi:alkylation response protein AidB-like acyl-CoA dehydrogenase